MIYPFDDMHWTAHYPECGKEFVFEGYFDITCTFRTKRIWIGDDHYIE